MRLGRESTNVEDRRGSGPGFGGFGGMGGRVGGLGLGGLLLLMLFGYVVTGDPLGLLTGSGGGVDPASHVNPSASGPPTDDAGKFVSQVLADTEDTWTQIFSAANRRYEPPRLVLFSDAVQSACGTSSSAVGPFYCPGDRRVYLDVSFFRELQQRFGAPGDFAEAYVIAHEVGHHVQNLLGLLNADRGLADRNTVSVRQELQADCLAGVWGHYAAAHNRLDPGDVEEGLNAAAAIGDDRIQRESQGHVTPETWTHGSSADRVRWFRQGLDSGEVGACDTSSAGR